MRNERLYVKKIKAFILSLLSSFLTNWRKDKSCFFKSLNMDMNEGSRGWFIHWAKSKIGGQEMNADEADKWSDY